MINCQIKNGNKKKNIRKLNNILNQDQSLQFSLTYMNMRKKKPKKLIAIDKPNKRSQRLRLVVRFSQNPSVVSKDELVDQTYQ